jgi:tetratricopeptide (TPR) repeat protein
VPPRGEISSLDSNRALEALVEKVQSFGGRVAELGLTGIVAVFGIEPLEDTPDRAAHVAMAIQKVAERARRDDPERVAVKIGIHVGQFPVGRAGGGAEIDFDAKREAGTVLEALVRAAAPGIILVSGAAAPFLERRFELVPAGALEQGHGLAYRLAGRERAGLGLGGRVTSFVGRSDELELLRSRLASAMRAQGQVVGIVGEPGIGKSRLLYEFRQSLGGAPVTYLEGRCLSYGSSIPYLPVLDMLRHACRLAETDSADVITEKVRLSLEVLGMEVEEAAPYLLARLGIKEGTDRLAVLTPEAINIRTREIFRQMCLQGSRQRPLILAVENLHWVDKASEAYFASVVETLPGASILLLLTYRPGYRPPWLGKTYATQMALQPLPPWDSLKVVHSVLQRDEIPDPLAQVILTKAEGNPFFLEELARVVRDQGDLRSSPRVPDTIQEVLLARIDRLPDEPKRLLQAASILGRQVSLRLLRKIWEGPGVPDAHLRELTRLEFLYEGTGVEEPVYVFKHALTQEVAYESLLAGNRQALHAAVGQELEAVYADRLEEAYDRLAYHYSKTEKVGKAVEYLTRFAEKAARGFAHEEAVAALQEALVHAERLPAEERERHLLDLVLRQAHSLSLLGRFQETLDLLLREQDRLEQLHAPSLAGPYHFWLAHTYSYLGDRERAARNARRALEEAERCGDEATMGKAYVVLAQEDSWSGQPLQGIERGRRAADLLERTEERWWLGLAYWMAGVNYITVGDFEQALEAEARALATGEAIGDPRIQSYATWTTGWIHVLTGEWERGIDAIKRGLERSPDPVNTAVVLGHLGYAYLEKRDLDQAIALLEQSVAQMTQFRFRRLQGRFTTFLGEAYLSNGQVERARELSSQGLEISREAGYRYGVGWARQVLGRIAQASGLLSEAEAHLKEALQTFASIHAQFMAGRTHLALAELAHAQGNQDAAATHLKEAHDRFRILKVPKYVERTEHLALKLEVPIAAKQ